jgi:hypothetical protein
VVHDVAGGDLVYGMPQLLAQTVTIPFPFPPLPVRSYTFNVVKSFPLLDQFLRDGLDDNLHSLARTLFAGGAPQPGPDITLDIDIPAPCVFVMLPETGKYIVIVVVWILAVLVVLLVVVWVLLRLLVSVLTLIPTLLVIIVKNLVQVFTMQQGGQATQVIVVQQVTQIPRPPQPAPEEERGMLTRARSAHDPVESFLALETGDRYLRDQDMAVPKSQAGQSVAFTETERTEVMRVVSTSTHLSHDDVLATVRQTLSRRRRELVRPDDFLGSDRLLGRAGYEEFERDVEEGKEQSTAVYAESASIHIRNAVDRREWTWGRQTEKL